MMTSLLNTLTLALTPGRHAQPTTWAAAPQLAPYTGPQPRDPRTHQPAARRKLKKLRKASQRRNRK